VGLARKDLGADEHVVVSVRTSVTPLLAPTILVLVAVGAAIELLTNIHVGTASIRTVVAAVVVAIPVLLLVRRFVAWRRRTVVLTTERVLVVDGILGRRTDQVSLDRIIDVQVTRRLRDRMVGRGDLLLEVVGGPGVIVEDIPKPQAFSRLLLKARDGNAGGGTPIESPLPAMPGASMPPVRIVTEGDPTPPRGTPAVSGSMAAVRHGRLEEIAELQRSGHLSAEEADRRRNEILGAP
jgi:hypothetical protein